MIREDDTPVHKAVREALTNSIIHADYQLAQLKKLGYLDRVGSDRAGHWVVKREEG